MKIRIGPYPDRLTCDIHNKYMDKKYGFYEWTDNKTKFDKFMEWLESNIQSLYNVLNWIWFDRRKQKVSIKIDKWDTWGMDYTLALIILPMIKQLQDTKHGSPIVDLEDVPEELRPSSEEKKFLLFPFCRFSNCKQSTNASLLSTTGGSSCCGTAMMTYIRIIVIPIIVVLLPSSTCQQARKIVLTMFSRPRYLRRK